MKVNRFYTLIFICAALALLIDAGSAASKEGGKIVHDAEY